MPTHKEIQLEALLESLSHWLDNYQAVCNGGLPLIGRIDCACCLIWNDNLRPNPCPCHGCPIYADTNAPACVHTPYEEVSWLVDAIKDIPLDDEDSLQRRDDLFSELLPAVEAEYRYLANLTHNLIHEIQKET